MNMKTCTRRKSRGPDKLRAWKITSGVLEHAEGSALIECGRTKVLCAASVEDRVPQFLKNAGKGWITAEYSMLPRATHTRFPRERGSKIGGRTMEIQRLVGRSLRAVVDLSQLGERTITIDCDVIQADGGTRVAAITGGWVALRDAVQTLHGQGSIPRNPLLDSVAAVSVGMLGTTMFLDLDYEEDATADVDMNVIVTGKGQLVEVQATAEGKPFSLTRMNSLVRLACRGLKEIKKIQEACST